MAILTEADDLLRTWLGSVAGGVPVLAGVPADGATQPALTAYLLGLEPTASLSRAGQLPAPVVVRLRYLLCADAADAAGALALLDSVMTAALDLNELDGHRVEVDLDPVPAETWLALGARLRPSFTLRIDARHVRLPAEVPLVREPLTLTGGTVRSLSGRLLGPGDVPLMGAEVTVMATGTADRTSSAGAFSFGAVPSQGSVRLAVRAKGRMFIADVDPDDGDPVVVRCDPLEG
jgi:hypothetical protein